MEGRPREWRRSVSVHQTPGTNDERYTALAQTEDLKSTEDETKALADLLHDVLFDFCPLRPPPRALGPR